MRIALLLFFSMGLMLTSQAQLTDSTLTVFPNPFKDLIRFDVNYLTEDTVEILVFNRWGEVVGELYHDSVFTGSHTRYFDGTELSVGSYVYSLKVNGENQYGNIYKVGATSIFEQENSIYSFYPNPAKSEVFVKVFEPTNVQLFSLDGSLLQSWYLEESSVCELKPTLKGVYLLKIGEVVEKIIIENSL